MGFTFFIAYFVFAASAVLAARYFLLLSGELLRKGLHVVCVVSVFVLLYAFDTWYLAVLATMAFILAIYPVLVYIERFPKLIGLLTERHNGEAKTSLILAYSMMAVLITVFWGLMGEQWKFVVLAAVMSWGFGDAAAALAGKKWGHHPIRLRLAEKTKTWEGSLTMLFTSAIVVVLSLTGTTALPWYLCLLTAAAVAPVCMFTEMVSHHGMDTVLVPIAASVSICALHLLYSYLGVTLV